MFGQSKKLVVVADDFGWSSSVNRGLVKAHKEGSVTEVSLMLNSPGTDEALRLIESGKLIRVGLHLLLFNWLKNARRFNREDYLRLFREKNEEEISELAKQEFSQFEREVGRKPTHICPQYGSHGNLKLLRVIIDYAKENRIPVRLPRTLLVHDEPNNQNYAAEILLKRSGVKSTDHLFGQVLGADLVKVKKAFLEDLGKVKAFQSAEMVFHPAYFDRELLETSSLNFERARDLALCLDRDFWKEVRRLGFKLVDYSRI